jgi:hypothetical protein
VVVAFKFVAGAAAVVNAFIRAVAVAEPGAGLAAAEEQVRAFWVYAGLAEALAATPPPPGRSSTHRLVSASHASSAWDALSRSERSALKPTKAVSQIRTKSGPLVSKVLLLLGVSISKPKEPATCR